MHLMLAVETYQGSAPDAPLVCRFGAAGGTIGRGPDNAMVLPDAAKTVSRVHARIDWSEEGWRFADLGSNPSRVNGRPLSGGQPARLAQGDVLEIGGYRLGVRAIERVPAAAFDAPLGVHDRRGFDPLDPLDPASVGDGVVTEALVHDPLARAAVLADAPLPGARFDPFADPYDAAARLDGHAAFAGSESDHVPPEQFAYMAPVSQAHGLEGGIPHDYDPLGDIAVAVDHVERAAPERTKSLPMRAAANDAVAESAFAALLDGMGVDAGAVGARDPAEIARLAGAMLRTAVRGVVDVLLSRSVLKREISLDTTMLVQRDNNPLKFFPDGDGALAQMLRGGSAGYLPAQTALEGAFDDIRRHELAVLAGTRAAMQQLLARFDPQTIARDETRRGWLDWLPACRKARQWDRLVALHGQLQRASADDLQALSGSAFNDAYERQANGFADAKPLAPSISH
ncbi:type VI secretion system-associated FHA domain protein TagH [Caballeronia sp. BR00000012568055]|uniref:type VI secretion system-associated FHA domain protein TagH n=1 Tax=Caballeronia sp. BR00000012568055 TaxID=2918761 RepID=UPI0023F83D74|nr:type VI secretion system-associated FHA domain protein TagH [Caballeronia sp. BR00000012568055]